MLIFTGKSSAFRAAHKLAILIMKTVIKYKLEIGFAFYWLIHAINLVFASKNIGYYPPLVRTHARTIAETLPYPWQEIFMAWLLLAVLNFCIYLILRRSGHAVRNVSLLLGMILLGQIIFIPSDMGGLDTGFFEYFICTLLITLSYWVFFEGKE
jgi:hypothetical protein